MAVPVRDTDQKVTTDESLKCIFWLRVQLIESRVSTIHTAVEVSSGLDLVCIVLP